MPNPTRLYRLIQLREAVGLNQTDMAQRCGLYGNQSRKTISAWETGETIPRASRRVAFIHYLWHDLRLHQEPALFEEVWSMLGEEWGWAPLCDNERQQLLVTPHIPLPLVPTSETEMTMPASSNDAEAIGSVKIKATLPELTPPLSALVVDSLVATPTVSAMAATVVPSAETALPSSLLTPAIVEPLPWWGILRTKYWLPVLISLILLIWISVYLWRKPILVVVPPPPVVAVHTVVAPTLSSPDIDLVQPVSTQPVLSGLTQGVALSSLTPLALNNGGFDQPVHFAGWQATSGCDYRVVADGAIAHAGERYLAIQNRRPRCYSFYQDLFVRPQVGATYRAAIWLRSAGGEVRRGRFTLWALGADRDYHETIFDVGNTAWTCLETMLTIRQPAHDHFRFELYLDSYDGRDYYFDSAVLAQGSTSLCPSPRLAIADLQLVQPSGRIYPGATVGVQTLVQNIGATDLPQATFVRYWVAEHEDGEPIDRHAVRQVPVPPLATGESFSTTHMDVYLPINLPVGPTYFLVADLATTDQLDDIRWGLDRIATSFSILPCSPGSLFCDVPADHWAITEIQAWFDAGITEGCRSTTEPFLNRPFCPDGVVQRWMMAIFLFRQLEGKDYQPTNAYQGLFEDLPEDFDNHQSALRIEALTTQRVALRSDACPPRGEHARFCPRDPLRRIDFVRALLALQRWDVSQIAGTRFTDLAAGSLEAQAAEYMALQGYLPEDDTDCPDSASYRRFCPNAPLRRASAAVMMSRALGLVEPGK